ncbi:MAG TPA: hemolysin family protein [Egibacteraceae bacterium]|nr:hemolysin family protein [Egibacteraceae bacterium]
MSGGAVVIALALLAANALFVAAEFALLAARRSKIEQLAAEGDRRAAHALAGLRELSLMLAAAQLGITMASLGLGIVAEPAVASGLEILLENVAIPSGVRHGIAFTVALSIVVFLHMVVGEMAPKSWAISHPERSALMLARPFRAFALVFRPFIRLLNAMANGVVRTLGVEPQDELAMTHSPGDLLLLLEESAREGQLGAEERRLLSRAIDLAALDAEAAMIPRRDMVVVSADLGVDGLEQVASRTGRSRIPVHDGDLDRIRGVLHVKDLLRLEPQERERATAGSLARPALITPESRGIEDLMVDMRQQRQHIAIVVDEYGSVSGLVALEDLLEELLGEFEDESDRGSGRIRRAADGALLIPGATRPDQLREEIGVELPEGEWETVAGLVIAQLGRLPELGDETAVEGLRLRVTRLDGHRITEVAVRSDAQD